MDSARSGPLVHLVLYHPEIPQNAGNIGRLALGIGAALHLVHPLSFDTSEKAVRRAGLDYWRAVDLTEHPSADAFWAWAEARRVYLFSSHGKRSFTTLPYERGDVLVFGKETLGLPADLIESRGAWRIPMPGPTRSLNLANAVSIVAYHALERIEPHWFLDEGARES